MTTARNRSFKIQVPASSANLGCGFDCLALALNLYLNVHATVLTKAGEKSSAHSRGVQGSLELPTTPENNLILRAMRHTAEREHFQLPAVHLDVHNDIPLASGLGSSAAAVVAGVALAYKIARKKVSEKTLLQRAAEIEGHADNAASALLGGLAVAISRDAATYEAIRLPWPKHIRVVAVTPSRSLNTKASRAALPATVSLPDAVHNLQRSALFVAAIQSRRYEMLRDAMQDRLHQPFRKSLVPGLEEILAMELPRQVLGVALSGAGPSVILLATARYREIGTLVAERFKNHGMDSTVRVLQVSNQGIAISAAAPRLLPDNAFHS